MGTLAPRLLIAAAQQHLRRGKQKGLPPAGCLHLAGEVLAVASGLKPAFLYDYNAVGVEQVQSYLRHVQDVGLTRQPLHLLSIADHILILNLEKTVLHLESLLLRSKVLLVDVSASRERPRLGEPEQVDSVKGHVSDLLAHVKAVERVASQPVSTSQIFSADWNLCTVFGVLLGYPASYVFNAEKGFENCLSLTPLRVFTVQASCPRISKDLRVHIYSFSVPENLYLPMKEELDLWRGRLKDLFSSQSDFVNVVVSTEVVSLAAVAL